MQSVFLNKLKQNLIFSLGIFFAFTTFLVPQISHADALLPGIISTCGELTLPGIYTLTQSVVAAGTSTCFSVSSDGVILDGGGFTITGTGPIAIDARARTGGVTGTLTEGANGYTNLIVNNINISGFTTGINSSGNTDASGLGIANGYGGDGGDVAIYSSSVGSVFTQGGNSSVRQYGGLGGNIMFTHTNLNISSSTLSAVGGIGTLGINIDGGLTLKYSGTLTKTNVVLSSFSFFNDNGTQYGIYVGGTWPLFPGSISACGTLFGSGTYTLSQNIAGVTGTCFVIGSNNITLDGAGHSIAPSISTTTSYVVNANNFQNFTLASTTVTNFANLITSSSSVIVSGDTLNLTNKKIVSPNITINSKALNVASTTFISDILNINYSTSITGTSTASSTALSLLMINNLSYGTRVAGLVFNEAWVLRASGATRYWGSISSSADGLKLIAGNSLYVYTSTDSGSSWATTTVTGNSGSGSWYTASSADGKKLVVGSCTSYIYTSINSGVTWTQQASSGVRCWQSFASSADGKKLVATVQNGYIYTSSDSGITWVATNSGQKSWYAGSIASSADGTKLVAVVGGGYSDFIYTSSDSGVTWIPRDSSRTWWSVASSADGTKLVAGMYNG